MNKENFQENLREQCPPDDFFAIDRIRKLCINYQGNWITEFTKGPHKVNDRLVYMSTRFRKGIFNVIKNKCKFPQIIVGHDDISITEDDILKLPDNVKKWFVTNVSIESDRIAPMPLGICSRDFTFHQYFMKNSLKREKTNNILLFNCSKIRKQDIRHNVYEYCKDKDYIFNPDRRLQRQEFLDTVRDSVFVLSPPGSGIDCHRTWEALYLGAIPICLNKPELLHFKSLPILFVDDYEQITEAFLLEKKEEIYNREWNYDLSKYSYWKEKLILAIEGKGI
jgi:hypothetical protein